jgi:hypothetical protein
VDADLASRKFVVGRGGGPIQATYLVGRAPRAPAREEAGDVVHLARKELREGASHDKPVQETGIVIGDGIARLRAAGAAKPDREFHRPKVFDKACSGHQRCLGSQQILAVVAVDAQARGGDTVSLPQMQIFQNATVSDAGTLDVPTADAAAAKRVDEAVLPRGRRVERGRSFFGGRVMQNRGFVDPAVDGGLAETGQRLEVASACVLHVAQST